MSCFRDPSAQGQECGPGLLSPLISQDLNLFGCISDVESHVSVSVQSTTHLSTTHTLASKAQPIIQEESIRQILMHSGLVVGGDGATDLANCNWTITMCTTCALEGRPSAVESCVASPQSSDSPLWPAAAVHSFTLRTARSENAWVSERCGVEVSRVHQHSSQAARCTLSRVSPREAYNAAGVTMFRLRFFFCFSLEHSKSSMRMHLGK